MRTTLYPLVLALAGAVDVLEPIYEFGSLRVDAQTALPPISATFPGKAYVGADMRPGRGVDEILDLHALDLPDESVGSALVLDVLEHVEYPRRALDELHRSLKPGGFLLITSVFYFPIHAAPDDYWRFTPSAFRSLLSGFDLSLAAAAGSARLPHTAVGIAAKEPFDPQAWDRAATVVGDWCASGATSWKERALMGLPPALLVRGYAGFESLARRRSSRA